MASNCNLDKTFALSGKLGQVHMAKKIFLIFLHAGKMVIFVTEIRRKWLLHTPGPHLMLLLGLGKIHSTLIYSTSA